MHLFHACMVNIYCTCKTKNISHTTHLQSSSPTNTVNLSIVLISDICTTHFPIECLRKAFRKHYLRWESTDEMNKRTHSVSAMSAYSRQTGGLQANDHGCRVPWIPVNSTRNVSNFWTAYLKLRLFWVTSCLLPVHVRSPNQLCKLAGRAKQWKWNALCIEFLWISCILFPLSRRRSRWFESGNCEVMSMCQKCSV